MEHQAGMVGLTVNLQENQAKTGMVVNYVAIIIASLDSAWFSN